MDWENMFVDENELGEGLNSDSSGSLSLEDDDFESETSSFTGDDLNDSDFEDDEMLIEDDIVNEIVVVGERVQPNSAKMKNVPVHLKDRASQLSSNNETRKTREVHVYDEDLNNSDFEFEVGLCFNSPSDFREAVRTYATKQGKPIKFTKNCSDKIQVSCECGWVMFASFMSKHEKTFQVKTIKGEHSCYRVASSKHCNSKHLAQKYEHNIRSNPEWPAHSMLEIMQRDTKSTLSMSKMYRAKKHAKRMLCGTELEQYAKLWDYFEEIHRTNPGTTIKMDCKHDVGTQTCIFKRLYICWGALKKGFMSGCRPIIGLDGTHLRTSTGGVLLCAVGVDGNNNMYPIAYAIVLKENTKSWKWFVSLLIEDLCMENTFAWSIISDKQKGLLIAIEELLPNAEHRFCLRHMYNNFKKIHRGLQLKDLLWKAASATRVVDFNYEMEKLKASDSKAYEWVKARDPKHWAKSHFNTWPKCDMLLNNFCEAFNKVILKARDKPIITMLETIRVLLMKRLQMQIEKVFLKFNGPICPSVQKQLETNKKNAHNYILIWNGHDKFEVEGFIGDKWTIDLGARACSCRRWELTGIPCVHATACIFYRRENVEAYVENWYSKDMFIRAYEHLLNPIKSYKEWPCANLNPVVPWADIYNKPGRPSKHARRKEEGEVEGQKYGIKRHGMKYNCSNCGRRGHNKKSCVEGTSTQATTSTTNLKIPVRRNTGS